MLKNGFAHNEWMHICSRDAMSLSSSAKMPCIHYNKVLMAYLFQYLRIAFSSRLSEKMKELRLHLYVYVIRLLWYRVPRKCQR